MNLKFITRIAREIIPWKKEFALPAEILEHRNHIVLTSALKFYDETEVRQVLTNRRSDYSDTAVISNFELTEQPPHPIPFDGHTSRAIEVTTQSFRPSETLYPVAYPDLRYYPWTLPTSAEAPWTLQTFTFVPFQTTYDWLDNAWKTFKGKVTKAFRTREWLRYKQAIGTTTDDNPSFHNLYNEIFVYNRALVHEIKYGSRNFWSQEGEPKTYYWNTLHARSHVVSEDEPDKIRAVFGVPKLLLQVENMFIWQMQRCYLNNDEGRLLWGREIMKGGWRKLMREIESEGSPNTVIAMDWSQFDRRLLFSLMTIVHEIWRSYFSFERYHPTSRYPDAFPKSTEHLERLWTWMCYSILHNPILLPDARLFKWTYNGFASGYQQTQLMDSFCNMIMILTCLSSLGIDIESDRFWIRVQGDDSLVSFFERAYDIYGPHFLDMLAAAALYYFNAKLSVKKSSISKRLSGMTVLGYFNTYGFPKRTDEDLLRHLFFPERDQDWTRLAASAMGLAMASCGCSTRFYNTCRDIWRRLVEVRGVKPRFSAIRWMERANMIERIDALEGVPFPSRIRLAALGWNEPIRSESSKERLWPTKPGSAGGFYFL